MQRLRLFFVIWFEVRQRFVRFCLKFGCSQVLVNDCQQYWYRKVGFFLCGVEGFLWYYRVFLQEFQKEIQILMVDLGRRGLFLFVCCLQQGQFYREVDGQESVMWESIFRFFYLQGRVKCFYVWGGNNFCILSGLVLFYFFRV